MNTLYFRELLKGPVHLLNQPFIKEGVKNVAGLATFAFGLVEIVDLYQIFQGGSLSTEDLSDYPEWMQTVQKVIVVCAKISLVLSAGVSRPGVYIISSLTGVFFTGEQLSRVFGPNTIFAVNPWHPRHVVSIAAVVLALPSLIQAVALGIHFLYQKFRQLPAPPADEKAHPCLPLSDQMMRMMTFFNTFTSRPVLHLGNRWGSLLISR